MSDFQPEELLNIFAEVLIDRVRDYSIIEGELILRGKIQKYQKAFAPFLGSLNLDQTQVLHEFLYLMVDTAMGEMLRVIGEADAGIKMTMPDPETGFDFDIRYLAGTTDLKDYSSDWIAKFSKKPSSLTFRLLKQQQEQEQEQKNESSTG